MGLLKVRMFVEQEAFFSSPITQALLQRLKRILHLGATLLLLVGLRPLTTRDSDRVLRKVGRIARANEVSPGKRNYVFVTGYYFRNLHMIWDGLLALSLRARGEAVLGVSTGGFFQDECLYFGGNYLGVGRDREILRVRNLEYLWWRKVLRLPHLFIADYAGPGDSGVAVDLLDGLTTADALRKLQFKGVDVGKQAYLVTVNMLDQVDFDGRQDEYESMKTHCKNIVRYILAFERFFASNEITALVSNWPMYYKWSVPYALGRARGLDFFCYGVGDKKSSFHFAKNPTLYSMWDLENVDSAWERIHPEITEFSALRQDTLDFFDSATRSHTNAYVLNDRERVSANLDLPGKRSKVLVPLNVLADAAVLLGTPEGRSYREFLRGLGDLARNCRDIDFILKAHPDEKVMAVFSPGQRPSVETVLNELEVLGERNVYFINSSTSTRVSELLNQINFVLCFTSSVVYEASIRGVPCIQVGLSGTYDLPFTIKPQSFHEVPDILRGKSRLKAKPNFSELALKSFLLSYVYAQVDLGLTKGTDFGPVAEVVGDVTPLKILDNPILESLCRRIIARHRWFSELAPPPLPSGPVRITATGLRKG